MAIHSYPGANETLKRHWPMFWCAEADEICIIGTTDGGTWAPEGIWLHFIGANEYINAAHLPQRLVDTFAEMLKSKHTHLCVCEYDTLFFNRLRIEAMEHGAAAHLTGWHIPDYAFYHNPWLMHREVAARFVEEGRKVIAEGICGYSTQESSPDVFFGLVCHRMKQPVQGNLWTEFSRNSLDCSGDLDRAREAYRNGVDVLHGVKTGYELNYITS